MPTTIIGRASTSPRIAPLAITKPATVGKIARREVTRRNFTLAAERTALIHSLRSSGGFLVADTVNFDWRTAPFRHYASFEDFYRSEPEPTWEVWDQVQKTCCRRMVGASMTSSPEAQIGLN